MQGTRLKYIETMSWLCNGLVDMNITQNHQTIILPRLTGPRKSPGGVGEGGIPPGHTN